MFTQMYCRNIYLEDVVIVRYALLLALKMI